MKVPAQDLVRLVREITQDEIKKQLPGLVREMIAEQYLRRLVSEQVGSRSSRDLVEISDDEIPEPTNPIADDNEGIYHPTNPKIQEKIPARTEVVHKLLSRDDPSLAFVFEGTKPLKEVESVVANPAPSLDQLQQAGLDFNRMRRLALATEKKNFDSRPMSTPNQKMREIEERRKQLEVPVQVRERK